MFKNVIVKNPGNSFVNGLTTSDLGKPILEKLFEQHENYVEALKNVVLRSLNYQRMKHFQIQHL